MKPVFQTRFGQNPDGPGNCFSACVASILECELADLPDEAKIVVGLKTEFADKWHSWPDRFKWNKSWGRLWEQTQAECLRRGLFMIEVRGPFGSEITPDVWCIVSGKSPRDIPHACVGRGIGCVVHDPHPDGGGVDLNDCTYIFFVAVDPAADHTHPECPIDPVRESLEGWPA